MLERKRGKPSPRSGNLGRESQAWYWWDLGEFLWKIVAQNSMTG